MTDSNATERFTTLCAMLTEFEDAALAIRVEASDTQAREEVWRNAIGDLAQEYANEIEGMYTPEQAIAATLGAGECEAIHDMDYYRGINGICEGLYCSKCGEPLSSKFKCCPWCGAKIRKAVKQ